MTQQPSPDLRSLVGGDVVHDEVDIELLGNRTIDAVQEPAELLGPVSFGHGGDHLAGRHIESGIEVGRSVADVVMRASFGQTRRKRQHRRCPVQGLDLGLFVHAEHQRTVGRVDVETDDVTDFLDELGIG